MALVTCYDPQGNPHQKEPVDARECVKYCGYTMEAPDVNLIGQAASVPKVEIPVEPTIPLPPPEKPLAEPVQMLPPAEPTSAVEDPPSAPWNKK